MREKCLGDIYEELEQNYNTTFVMYRFKEELHGEKIVEFITEIRKVLLPEYFICKKISLNKVNQIQEKIELLMRLTSNEDSFAQNNALDFIKKLPKLRELILQDIESAFVKDPAARSTEEIAIAYPGIFAVMVHRIAHELHKLGYSLLARLLSEHAHSKTGIDIHPGAHIGHSFFMDHGTGIVIGETTEIGNHVTIYQGVTLGAFSFQQDENGNVIKGLKRHPTIEDEVNIYAGATILGGETIVGRRSIIGGNVWLTESVPENSKVISKFQTKILY